MKNVRLALRRCAVACWEAICQSLRRQMSELDFSHWASRGLHQGLQNRMGDYPAEKGAFSSQDHYGGADLLSAGEGDVCRPLWYDEHLSQ